MDFIALFITLLLLLSSTAWPEYTTIRYVFNSSLFCWSVQVPSRGKAKKKGMVCKVRRRGQLFSVWLGTDLLSQLRLQDLYQQQGLRLQVHQEN